MFMLSFYHCVCGRCMEMLDSRRPPSPRYSESGAAPGHRVVAAVIMSVIIYCETSHKSEIPACQQAMKSEERRNFAPWQVVRILLPRVSTHANAIRRVKKKTTMGWVRQFPSNIISFCNIHSYNNKGIYSWSTGSRSPHPQHYFYNSAASDLPDIRPQSQSVSRQQRAGDVTVAG